MVIAHGGQLRPLLRRTLTYATIVVAVPLLWWMGAIAALFGHGDALYVLVPLLTTVLLAFAIRLASLPRIGLGAT
jgi:hypothetical protein